MDDESTDDRGTCCEVWGASHHDRFVFACSDGLAAARSVEDPRRGPWLEGRLELGNCVELLTTSGRVAVANYPAATFSVYDTDTGSRVWSLDGLKSPIGLACSALDRLWLLQYSGVCTEVDGRTGRRCSSIPGVSDVAAACDQPTVAMLRGRLADAEADLEVYTGSLDRPRFSLHLPASGLPQSAFGEDWLVLTSYVTNDIWCFDLDGRLRWSDRCPPECFCACLSRLPDPNLVLAIVVSGAMRTTGVLPMAIEYDLASGRKVRARPFPKGGAVPIAQGRYTVMSDGYLDVETLELVRMEWGSAG